MKIFFQVPEGVSGAIYLIGDSHVRALYEVCPQIFKKSNDILDVYESKSAYAVGIEGHDFYLKESLKIIPDGSKVLLSFGEIDCRHYIPKGAINEGKSIDSLVDEVINRFTANCVRLLMEKFRVMILAPYICPEDHNHHDNNSYLDILEAKTIFNRKLITYCEENGILFIPIFQTALDNKWDQQLQRDAYYFGDSSHLGPCMIPVILDAMKDFKWKGFDL